MFHYFILTRPTHDGDSSEHGEAALCHCRCSKCRGQERQVWSRWCEKKCFNRKTGWATLPQCLGATRIHSHAQLYYTTVRNFYLMV